MSNSKAFSHELAGFDRIKQVVSAAASGTSDSLIESVVEILLECCQTEDVPRFLAKVLGRVQLALHAEYAAVARAGGGHWSVEGQSGQRRNLPTGLLAEVLDREAASAEGNWIAAPLVMRRAAEGVLVAYGVKPGRETATIADALGAAIGVALTNVRSRQEQIRRTEELETLLNLAAQWNQTHEMAELLEQMAQAATRLLKSDRASIFLWDKPNRTLVGRPALGVEGGELRVPDNAGIVGLVVQHGLPRRVSSADLAEQQQINRSIDTRLGYQTRSLLCVPLRPPDGEMIGAFELINKLNGDFTDDDEAMLVELAGHAATALANTQELEELVATHRRLVDQAAEDVRLIGQSPPIQTLRSTIGRVAKTDLAVLILGENGTGKEVVSQAIHYLSSRRSKPFVAVNCAAIAETLLESELFGHEKGAFTDAHEARAGKFELANGGTLFLDEIGDLSRGGQAKLLRVLEEKIVVRVGGSKPIHTDARVIAATNQELAEMARQKKFREDLYFRLNVVTLELPPLRERGDDVLLLADHFLADFSRKARRRPPKLTPAARKRLVQHTWPGNVRELRNLMERLAYLTTEDRIEAEDLAFILSPRADGAAVWEFDGPLTEATHQFQVEYVKRAIERARGNMTDAAELLGLHRSNLYRKMRQLGMTVEEE